MKGSGGEDVREDLHSSFPEAVKKLSEFFKKPTPQKKAETLAALDRLLGDGIAARKQVEKWEQPELDLE